MPALQKGTYDLYLLLVDGSFGFQPAYTVETFFRTHPVASLFIYIIYDALPVAMAIVYAVHMSKCNSKVLHAATANCNSIPRVDTL